MSRLHPYTSIPDVYFKKWPNRQALKKTAKESVWTNGVVECPKLVLNNILEKIPAENNVNFASRYVQSTS